MQRSSLMMAADSLKVYMVASMDLELVAINLGGNDGETDGAFEFIVKSRVVSHPSRVVERLAWAERIGSNGA